MDKVYIIYQILNKINNKVYRGVYTGKDIKINYILPRNKNIKEDIKKLGKENFEKSILYKSYDKNDFIINKKKLINIEWKKSVNTYNDSLIGLIAVVDKEGKHYKVKNDDPRYINGELIFFSKGKCAARDKDGNSLFVDKNDPRFLTEEIVSTTKGKFAAKDKDGNIFSANINDLRYINGEICSVNKGNKIKGKALENVTKSQKERRIKEYRIKYPNFKFDIEKCFIDRHFLIKNFCLHGDLSIEYRLFNKLYKLENNKETIFYCEKCVNEFIKNYIPLELDIIRYREICNELHHKQVRYLFKEYYLKYYNPKLYKCIFYFTRYFKEISLIERIYMFRNDIQRPKCLVKKCCNKPRYSFSNKRYNLYCDEHFILLDNYFSIEQNKIKNYITKLIPNIEIKNNDRHLKKELDIYIPSLKLAFEYNGVYFHNENHINDKLYHYNKWLVAKNDGIKLITIWEDDWKDKEEIIKSIIKNQLKLTDNKIYGRKCIIKEVNFNEAKIFLENNHIQGNVNSSLRLGLFSNDELISLMSFGSPRVKKDRIKGNIELLRFCSKLNTNVIGGASKLFKYFIKNYKYDKIISYANLDISDGNLYEELEFENKGWTGVDYWWAKYKRFNRVNFQKHKLVKQGYDKDKTENEIMRELGYSKIWGIGNLKYEYINKQNN